MPFRHYKKNRCLQDRRGMPDFFSQPGKNVLTILGIGFITALDGTGLTEDMPNFKEATYTGNYVANVQAADAGGQGAIERMDGAMSMKADFSKDEITANLTDLIELEGLSRVTGFQETKHQFSILTTTPKVFKKAREIV